MRCMWAFTAALFAMISGCGQAEPDRYKTKFTERPSKSVPSSNSKETTKEKGPDSGPPAKAIPQEQPKEPAKGK